MVGLIPGANYNGSHEADPDGSSRGEMARGTRALSLLLQQVLQDSVIIDRQ
jgi:hypothetical protein